MKQSAESLHVLSLNLTEGGCCGDVETVLAPPGAFLDVAFGSDGAPGAGWVPVGSGIAHVREMEGLARSGSGSKADCAWGPTKSARCTWSVPPRGDPVVILLLPQGRRLANPEPRPLHEFNFGGRQAVVWRPGRRPVAWNMDYATRSVPAAPVSKDDPGGFGGQPQPGELTQRQTEEKAGAYRRRSRLVGAAAALLLLLLSGALVMSGLRRHPQEPPARSSSAMRGVDPIEEPAAGSVPPSGHSYGLTIGIDAYPVARWRRLTYARKDAEGMARYLRGQGFEEVTTLLDEQATKTAIIHKMQNDLAPRLEANDRVLVFFAGHGHTERLDERDWGYLVPYDGGDNSATYISMEELQTLSEKMGRARHQLFILDACYGGLLAMRSGGIDPATPNYIREINRRPARQILTAGGRDQQVLDAGPDGHSVFTGYLLECLESGLADANGDGFITFAELVSYVVPRASNRYQTPAASTLPGHGLGEFVFRVTGSPRMDAGAGAGTPATPAHKGERKP